MEWIKWAHCHLTTAAVVTCDTWNDLIAHKIRSLEAVNIQIHCDVEEYVEEQKKLQHSVSIKDCLKCNQRVLLNALSVISNLT